MIRFTRLATALGMAVAVSGTAGAQEKDAELPKQLSWTAYDTGSAGYNQAVAMGAALQDAMGINLRVLPGKNDVSRTEPLRQGKVQFSATGVGGSFMAQEGAFDFGAENWGPQPVRVIAANNGGAINLAVGVAGDAGVENYSDLKGKRVAFIVGAPALNVNTEGLPRLWRADLGRRGAGRFRWFRRILEGVDRGPGRRGLRLHQLGHGLRGSVEPARADLAAD